MASLPASVLSSILLAILSSPPIEASRCRGSVPNSDLSWFKNHAQALLFMEHLQQRAAEEDLYGWSSLVSSDAFRNQLRDLESEFVIPDDLDCPFDQPAAQGSNSLAERIAFIEDRLESCTAGCSGVAGASQGAGEGLSVVLRRMSELQDELMRQRSVIRAMRTRLVSINRQAEGKALETLFTSSP